MINGGASKLSTDEEEDTVWKEPRKPRPRLVPESVGLGSVQDAGPPKSTGLGGYRSCGPSGSAGTAVTTGHS